MREGYSTCSVCVSVYVSVCLCVCFPYSGTSRNQAYKQQYQRLQRDTGMKYKKKISLKRFVPKIWRPLLTSSSSGVVSGRDPSAVFSTKLGSTLLRKPIATVSLHRQRTSRRQRASHLHRLVNGVVYGSLLIILMKSTEVQTLGTI